MTTPIRPAEPGPCGCWRMDCPGVQDCDVPPELRYDVLYHPSYEWWQQLEGRDTPLPYSSYPVVARGGLTLAEVREFIAAQGVPSEWYTVRPTGEETPTVPPDEQLPEGEGFTW